MRIKVTAMRVPVARLTTSVGSISGGCGSLFYNAAIMLLFREGIKLRMRVESWEPEYPPIPLGRAEVVGEAEGEISEKALKELERIIRLAQLWDKTVQALREGKLPEGATPAQIARDYIAAVWAEKEFFAKSGGAPSQRYDLEAYPFGVKPETYGPVVTQLGGNPLACLCQCAFLGGHLKAQEARELFTSLSS